MSDYAKVCVACGLVRERAPECPRCGTFSHGYLPKGETVPKWAVERDRQWVERSGGQQGLGL